MFPERGEEICQSPFGNPVLNPRGYFCGYTFIVKYLRDVYKKSFEKLDGIVASTVYPILYFGKQS